MYLINNYFLVKSRTRELNNAQFAFPGTDKLRSYLKVFTKDTIRLNLRQLTVLKTIWFNHHLLKR